MNAKEYMAYREEQKHIERKNRQSVQENALVSAVCPTKNVITHKTQEITARGLIRATLKGYSKLNAEVEKLRIVFTDIRLAQALPSMGIVLYELIKNGIYLI